MLDRAVAQHTVEGLVGEVQVGGIADLEGDAIGVGRHPLADTIDLRLGEVDGDDPQIGALVGEVLGEHSAAATDVQHIAVLREVRQEVLVDRVP